MTHGPDAISEALSTLSSEVRPSLPADSKGKNVKDILRSLVSPPSDDVTVDPNLLPPSFLGNMGDMTRESFRSFDRWELRCTREMRIHTSVSALSYGDCGGEKKKSKINSVLAGVQTSSVSLQPIWCLFSCDSQASHLIVLFIHLNISTGDLEAIPVVLSEKTLVKNSVTENLLNHQIGLRVFFLLFSFFLTFLLSLRHTCTALQGMCFGINRSPVLDEVDRNVSFQHLADIQRYSFIISLAADLMFEPLAAVFFVWHKSCII